MESWYEKWFNSKEYISVYKHRNEQEARKLVSLIIEKLSPPPGSGIIDLACGYGRHSLIFAEKGYRVTGVDISQTLIELARTEAESRKLDAEFVRGNYHELEWHEEFNIALNLFTSFGYDDEDEINFNLFTTAHRLLKPLGYFVFDFFNSNHVQTNLETTSLEEMDGVIVEQKREIIRDTVFKEIIIRRGGETERFEEKVKLYKPGLLKEKLVSAGFRILDLYGDYNGSNFNDEKSRRFLAICEKKS